MDRAKKTARQDENHLSLGIWCTLYWRFYGNWNSYTGKIASLYWGMPPGPSLFQVMDCACSLLSHPKPLCIYRQLFPWKKICGFLIKIKGKGQGVNIADLATICYVQHKNITILYQYKDQFSRCNNFHYTDKGVVRMTSLYNGILFIVRQQFYIENSILSITLQALCVPKLSDCQILFTYKRHPYLDVMSRPWASNGLPIVRASKGQNTPMFHDDVITCSECASQVYNSDYDLNNSYMNPLRLTDDMLASD